ncbi:type II secretion system protein [bacterium]|nr:type II secretion system protein [bacterium]
MRIFLCSILKIIKFLPPPYFFYKRSRQENFSSFSGSNNNLLNRSFGQCNAFTLAEVLITLVIIGVIAAITVPTLMNKTNNQEYVSRLKKAYSTMSQATNLIIAEEGTAQADKGGWADSGNHIYELYKKHLNNAKECGAFSNCYNGNYKKLSGPDYPWEWRSIGDMHKLILSDGTQIIFEHDNAACESFGVFENRCMQIIIDVNGNKKPNKLGRDAFYFVLQPYSFVPAGCSNTSNCNVTDGSGTSCACRVLREGAINY